MNSWPVGAYGLRKEALPSLAIVRVPRVESITGRVFGVWCDVYAPEDPRPAARLAWEIARDFPELFAELYP